MNYFQLSRFFLYLVPLTTVIVTRSTLFPFIVGKYSWFRFVVAVSLILFLLGLLKRTGGDEYEKRLKNIFRSPLTISVSLFTLFFLLAGFLGVNPSYSFWSNFERGEGGLQILNLFLFFILASVLFKEKDHWMKLFWMAVISALLMVLYGVGAGLGWQSFVGPKFGDSGFRFQGSIGNPAYVAAYLLFSVFYGAYIWLDKRKNRSKRKSAGSVFLAVSVIVFLAFFLLAATRGAFVGLIAGVLTALAYIGLQNKLWRKYAIASGVVLILVVSLMVKFKDSSLVKSIPGSRIFDLSFTTQTFEHRSIMWGIAWESFKERPILGWGPENFGYLFQRNFNPIYFSPATGFGAWFDRAHSVVFDYLAETGALGLASYLSMFAVACWIILKNKISSFHPTLFQKSLIIAAPITYLVQGLALFDVLVIYINIFLILAFVNSLYQKPDEEKKTRSHNPSSWIQSVKKPAILILIAASLSSIYLGSFLFFTKGQRYINAIQQARSAKNLDEFKEIYSKVLEYRAPVSEVEITKFFGGDVVEAATNGKQSEETSRELVKYLEDHSDTNEVIQLLNLATVYQVFVRKYGKIEDFQKSLAYFEKVRSIAPNLPQPLYVLFDMYRAAEEFDKAREIGNIIVKNWRDERIENSLKEFPASP